LEDASEKDLDTTPESGFKALKKFLILLNIKLRS
jgi:hypothetical protein